MLLRLIRIIKMLKSELLLFDGNFLLVQLTSVNSTQTELTELIGLSVGSNYIGQKKKKTSKHH